MKSAFRLIFLQEPRVSDEKNKVISLLKSVMLNLLKHPLVPRLKDAGFLTAWIAGIILVAGLSWFFTQSTRNYFLRMAVNRVLERSGDSRRLGSPLPAAKSGLGSWFNTTSGGIVPDGNRVYIFAFIGEGTFFPCAAVLSPQGKVNEFIPLNNHGTRIMKRIPPGILDIYTRRIEGAEP
jgi:hypothetical protein